MRSLILTGIAALACLPASAHPRVFVRAGFWLPRPVVVVRVAPYCAEPAPVVACHPWHRPYWHRRYECRRW